MRAGDRARGPELLRGSHRRGALGRRGGRHL